jgi:hypothetical protein
MARKHNQGRSAGGKLPEDYVPASKVDTNSESPKDYLPAPEDYSQVAKLANIPTERTFEFLLAVDRVVKEFRIFSHLDADRRHFMSAIREVETASKRLLRALEFLDEYEGGSAFDCFFHLDLQSFDRRPVEFSDWQEVFYLNGNWERVVPDGGSLADFKHRLWVLKYTSEWLSTKKRSVGQRDGDQLRRRETRTREFMERIKILMRDLWRKSNLQQA